MHNNSLSSKALESEESKPTSNDNNEDEHSDHQTVEEEIDFKESQFQIPPSFSRLIMEETLSNNDHPYIFWALLQLPIPKDPINPMATVFEALEEFVMTLVEEDPNFVVFPHNVIEYEVVEELPLLIETRKTYQATLMNGLCTSLKLNQGFLVVIHIPCYSLD